MDRVTLATRHLDLSARGLEIGPSYNPIVAKSTGALVEVVDHASREELVAKYRAFGLHDDQLNRIEEVDHVWRGGSLADLLGARGCYGWIIAAHVVEHTVDLIEFLQGCQDLLAADGVLSLVVPDKRYCFDRFQPHSSLGVVIDAHDDSRATHPPGPHIDHIAYATQRGPGVIAWDEETRTPIDLQFGDLSQAIEVAESVRHERSYRDVHRWKFTPSSFRLLIQDLRELGYHELLEVGHDPTLGFEFFVSYSRSGTSRPEQRLSLLLQVEEELSAPTERPVFSASNEERVAELAELLKMRERSVAGLEEQLAEVRASRSWRVTRPLRAAGSAVRALSPGRLRPKPSGNAPD